MLLQAPWIGLAWQQRPSVSTQCPPDCLKSSLCAAPVNVGEVVCNLYDAYVCIICPVRDVTHMRKCTTLPTWFSVLPTTMGRDRSSHVYCLLVNLRFCLCITLTLLTNDLGLQSGNETTCVQAYKIRKWHPMQRLTLIYLLLGYTKCINPCVVQRANMQWMRCRHEIVIYKWSGK